MAMQLDLFTGREVAPIFEGARDYDEPAKRAGLNGLFLQPCDGCPFCGICDSDECGQKLFDIDCDFNPFDYDEEGFDY